jgi:hypothetical protein
MQSVIDQLGKINQGSSEAEIFDALNKVAENKSDAGLRQHFIHLLKNEREQDQCALNILAAGFYAICLGGKYMQAGNPGSYQVHPFLHNLRKAMLACPLIREQLKTNARQYIFYTEFYEGIWNLRGRITAIAKAHTGADYGNDLLTVLYSLGGYFDKKDSEVGLRDAKRSGGTTCVMTARGIYHAAGAEMIGDRVPSVGTPNGPQVELGVPAYRTSTTGKRYLEATMQRDDQYAFGARGFDDNDPEERNRPKLEPGDIYYVDGDGNFKFLLRQGNAVAAHVGIVVDTLGTAVDTVDGGSGTGAKIDLNPKREVKFLKNIGWTLDKPGKSFTTGNIDDVEVYMAGFRGEDAVLNWLKQNSRAGKGILDQIATVEKNIKKHEKEEGKVKIMKQSRDGLIAAGRRLIREVKKGEKTLGQDRVLRGWWKPDRYAELRYVGRESLLKWLTT